MIITRWKATIVGIVLLVALAILLAPAPVLSATACERASQQPYVSVTIKPGRISYFNNRNRRGLRQIHSGYATSSGEWTPIGLTLAELALGLAVSVRAETMADGRYCAEIASVEATLGYDSIDVFIASEYARGSCQYNAILDHERLHVVVFQDTLDQYFARVERKLRQVANNAKPIITRDPDKAGRKLQEVLERAARPLFREINRTLDQRNGALDTHENYEREQSSCISW